MMNRMLRANTRTFAIAAVVIAACLWWRLRYRGLSNSQPLETDFEEDASAEIIGRYRSALERALADASIEELAGESA